MLENIPINASCAVFGKDECIYQCVLDDFINSKFIGIMTFNISPKTDSCLLSALKSACLNEAEAIIITNIPKRFPSYSSVQYASAAKQMINKYKQQLNPRDYGMRLNPYFSFQNHGKIVMTDNIIYWGSSNFSDESSRNFECGTISTDAELIQYVKGTLFPSVQNRSVPYYEYNFAIAIANLESLIPACQEAQDSLFEAAYEPWSDHDTNIEERWIYRTTDSGITVDFLRNFMQFFSQFDDALRIIDSIIDEYAECEELPAKVKILKDRFDEYRHTYDSFYETISSLFRDLEQMAQYDVSSEACNIISDDYGMEAYDEKLDYYAQRAFDQASEKYEELIRDSEPTVCAALDSLGSMIRYFNQLQSDLYKLLETDSRIDNTGIR